MKVIHHISKLFSGLLERFNEMRYAGRQNAFDREAAHGALLNRINANPPNPDPNAERGNNLHENQDLVNGMNGEGQNPNQDPLDHADENEDMLLGGAEERQQHHAPDDANAVREEVLQQAQAQAIPVPPVGQGRRAYHALTRENAEALNVLLTRELPVLTQQLQQTMELTNELLRRRLEEY